MNEALPDNIEKRNKELFKFFNKIFPNKITLLILNQSTPNVIYEDEKCLSCYVFNFELRLTDSPQKEKIICSINLLEEKYDIDKILFWLEKCQHMKMHKVKLDTAFPPLYLSGYNFTDRENKKNKYPVFSHYNPKLYFQKKKAEEIANQLMEEGYNVRCC